MSASQPKLTLEGLPTGLKFLTKGFVDLLFPTICAACGRLGPVICDACMDQIRPLGGCVCRRCGRPSANPVNSCKSCRKDNFCLEQSRACFTYSEPLTTVIHKFKYDGLFVLAEPLGAKMAEYWPDWNSPPDMLVPIPLHSRRKRMRGFNQSALLARRLGEQVQIEVNEEVLRRVRNTTPQVSLGPAQREPNVRDAFAADPSGVAGKHVLLLDDVFTTGATMSAAANALRKVGAARVTAYCLALALQ
jgi:competence protein ComFC